MSGRRKYIIKDVGNLDQNNRVIKFAWKLPSYCRELTGIMLFSANRVTQPATELNAEVSMWLNNQGTPVGNCFFPLGYHEPDDQECRMLDVNRQLIPGTECTG